MVIFISRDLPEDSPFLHTLSGQGHEVICESLLLFKALPFPIPAPTDWIFAYSTRGIQFFLEGLAKDSFSLAKATAFAAIGPGTAAAMRNMGISPSFTGSGDPRATAAEFATVAKGKKVLFPQAKASRRTIERLLSEQIEAIPLVVYESIFRTDFSFPEPQILVFTSPRNVQAYLGKYQIKGDQKVLAIGNTTASALEEMGIKQLIVAAEPTLAAMLEGVLGILKRN